MLVADLMERVEADPTQMESLTLSNLRIEGRTVQMFDEAPLTLDDGSIRLLSNFFDAGTGLEKITDDALLGTVLNHFKSRFDDSTAVVEYTDNSVLALYHSADNIIPRQRYVEAVMNTMPHEAEVRRFDYGRGKVVCDVSTTDRVVEPRVNDITEGGLRYVGFVSPRDFQPQVKPYAYRLWCANGATTEINTADLVSTIKVKGKTVEEVIQSIEENARRLMDGPVPEWLDNLNHMVEVPVEHPEQLVLRYGQEHGLGSRITNRIIEQIPALPDDERTLYDLTQLITSQQHADGVSQRQRELLQQVGGAIIAENGGHRCASCYQVVSN